MSSPGTAGPDSPTVEALARQVEELERRSGELAATLRRAARTRRLLTLVVAFLLAVYAYLYWSKGRAFLKNPDPLMQALTARARANSDDMLRETQKLVENAWPAVSDAFYDQFKKDLPTLMARFGNERDILATDLRNGIDERAKQRYHDALARHRTILEEQFPDVKDPAALAAMSDNMQKALDAMVEDYYGKRLAAEFDALYKTWDDFPLAEPGDYKGQSPEDALYAMLLELLRVKLTRVGDQPERSEARASGG